MNKLKKSPIAVNIAILSFATLLVLGVADKMGNSYPVVTVAVIACAIIASMVGLLQLNNK